MRVLFITRKWRPAVGGMESYSHELTAELQNQTRLTVRPLPGRRNGMPPGMLSLINFGIATSIYLIRRGRDFDVIHLGDMALWPFALLARVFARRSQLIASAHGSDVAFPLRRGLAPRLYSAYLRVGALAAPKLRVIANSRATAVRSRQAGYRVASVVPLGVRTAENPVAVEPEPYVLFVGRLVRGKGCGWFIRSVLPLLQANIRLAVAAVEWEKEEARALESDRVDFLGTVDRSRLRDLRCRALAVIVPNIYSDGREFEGFGLAALEAVADGGLLLASRVYGVIDAVVDGETGFLLPPEAPEAWAAKIHEILEWPLFARQEFIRGAVGRVRRDFSWERVARKTLEIYAEPEAARCGKRPG